MILPVSRSTQAWAGPGIVLANRWIRPRFVLAFWLVQVAYFSIAAFTF
jgi:hypothetical protein